MPASATPLLDFKEKVRFFLRTLYEDGGSEFKLFDLMPLSVYKEYAAKNAQEFEAMLEDAERNRWLKWVRKIPVSAGRVVYRHVQLTPLGMEEATKAIPMMFEDLPTCPLTGLPLNGQATFELLNGAEQVLYSFKPIGQAIFNLSHLAEIARAIAADNQRLHPDLAAHCREAFERKESVLTITYDMLTGGDIDGPKTFEEKQAHFLRLLYDTGSKEHKERDLYINQDFTLAFAKDSEEFTRILRAVITKGLLQYDKPNDTPNDWPYGIRTVYYGVLLTPSGEQSVIKTGASQSIPSTPSSSHQRSSLQMEKRYQIFISSTFADLQEERLKVQQTVMELDCIPAGMEAFPAIDEEQFEFIKRVIDDCDYYLLIIGGRYGSVSNTGVSYTEMEYDYAISKGIKAIVLLHKDPQLLSLSKSEQSDSSRKKLKAFRDKVSHGRLVKFWNNADELPGLVASSLAKTIRTYPAVGWVRANSVPSSSASKELAIVDTSSTPKVPTHTLQLTATMSDTPINKIFISHSSKDIGIVEEIIDLLEIVGVAPHQIFCSSFPGYSIELGQDFLKRIKDELNSNVLVLFVLSEHFYGSPISLCEMGAAWVQTRQHIPIVVPPLRFEDVRGVIPLTQGFMVNEPLKWNLFKERLEALLTLKSAASFSVWERKRDKAIQSINQRITEQGSKS